MSHQKIYNPCQFQNKHHAQHKASPLKTLDTARTRLFILGCGFAFVFLVVFARLTEVSLFSKYKAQLFGTCHQSTEHFRADIVDRKGELLATSLRTCSLYANPRVVLDPKEATEKLCLVLPELSPQDVLKRLKSRKGFVWIARHLTPQKKAEIIRLGIPGIYFQQDERRVYPHGSLFSHIIGFTDIDNHGLGGIEKKFNDTLISSNAPLQLSLDIRIQHILKDELFAGVEKFQAQGGAGIVLDVRSGEIIALVSLPDFDPNQARKHGPQSEVFFNKITLGAYEMGSSFKIFTTALYLENGGTNLARTFDVSEPIRIGRFKITDFHMANHPLTVSEVFTESSNIGAAKMALEIGAQKQTDFFKKLGLFKPAVLEVPEVGSPLYPKDWSKTTMITTSYGYGASISPLQLVTAIGGIVNKGVMHQPTLLSRKGGPSQVSGIRIVSEETSEIMRKLMCLVVTEGTGKKAYVKGYEVGGKTGTANTLSGKSYKKGENLTSFVGAFPMSRPEYLVLIMIDRPKPTPETHGFTAAGWNATPVAGKVVRRIAPLLQVVPTQEQQERQNMIPASFFLEKEPY